MTKNGYRKIGRQGKGITSYIASVKMFSNSDRKPRAPVFLAIVFFAINRRAISVKCSFTWYKNNQNKYLTNLSPLRTFYHFNENEWPNAMCIYNYLQQTNINTKLTLFMWNNFLYCLPSAFFVSVRTWE